MVLLGTNKLAKNLTDLPKLVGETLTKMEHSDTCYWIGGSKHDSIFKFDTAMRKISPSKYSRNPGAKLGFRDMKDWMPSDLILVDMVFPNCSLVVTLEPNDTLGVRRAGKVMFEEISASYMFFEESGFEFITCGGGERGLVSLIGYVSAFDNWIWEWVIATAIFSIVSLILFSKSVKFNTIFMPLDTVLEQGNSVYSSVANGTGIRHIAGVWVLVGIVVSNAYKGQNITDLSSPIPPIKPTKFSQLVEKNFTIFTHTQAEYATDAQSYVGAFVNAIFGKESYFQSRVFNNPFMQQQNILSSLIKNSDHTNEVVKQYMLIHEKIHNFTLYQLFDLTKRNGVMGYLEKIMMCDNTAFMGWSDEIETSRLLLDDILHENGRASEKQFISAGEETLFKLRKGWALSFVSVMSPNFERRMDIMVESGIGREWKEI